MPRYEVITRTPHPGGVTAGKRRTVEACDAKQAAEKILGKPLLTEGALMELRAVVTWQEAGRSTYAEFYAAS
jgi:hypothetical protein